MELEYQLEFLELEYDLGLVCDFQTRAERSVRKEKELIAQSVCKKKKLKLHSFYTAIIIFL